MMFHDRTHAGRLLAMSLEAYRAKRPIVLGLPRGGVPVAIEVARFLGAELDVLVVAKIGAPGSPDSAVGAVAEGGVIYVGPDVLREVGVGEAWLAQASNREAAEVVRRTHVYRPDQPARELSGRTVIVVDDGVATGATALAACRSARRRGSARIVLATPVIAQLRELALRTEFDAVVALERPAEFFAIDQFYERFEQLSDEDVVAYLYAATRRDAAVAVEQVGSSSDPG